MKKKYLKDEDNKKKAAADAFKSDAKGMMPPDPIQLKESSTEDVVKESITVVKDVSDYANYGDVILKNGDHLSDKSLLRQASEEVTKKKFGMEQKGGDLLGKGGKALDYAEIGIDMYDMMVGVKNHNKGKIVKSGTDALVKAIGLLGPLGAAFSTGYDVGSKIDEKTGASDKLYNSMGINDMAANESVEAKAWKAESSKKSIDLQREKKAEFKGHLIAISSLEKSKESILHSLGKILNCYPNEHEIPEMNFMISMPKIENVTAYTTVRTQVQEMMRLMPQLKSYKQALLSYINTLSRMVKIASKESKKFNLGGKTHFLETGKEGEKEYKKYNEEGKILEHGIVKVNRKGKIIGGEGIKYKTYNNSGALQEDGLFDFNKRGKKVNKRTTKLTIY